MEYISSSSFSLRNTCVTLGKFDGLHLGHRKLFALLEEEKRRSGCQSVVLAFDFRPGMFQEKKGFRFIYTEEEKKLLLAQAGIDCYISYPVTRETSGMEAEDFIRQILVEQLDARLIAVGEDNRFGHNRRGDAAMLRKFSLEGGFRVEALPKVRLDGETVSSTKIREELQRGNLERANAMLGAAYHIVGTVEQGRRLGRTLGFPTLNIIPPAKKLLPPFGVYASVTELGGERYAGVTNVGVRPTVGQQKRAWVETHLFDVQRDCYGELVQTELLHFLRPEQSFPDTEALREQLTRDIAAGRRYCEEMAQSFPQTVTKIINKL